MRVVRSVTVFLAWVLLAAGAAVGAWFAIDYAGSQVGGPAVPADVVLPAPVSTSPTPSPTSVPSGTPSPTVSPGVTPSASATPSASPSPSTGEKGTYNIVDAGALVVRCEGTAVTYWAVRPQDGWQADTTQTSVSVLEVVFNRLRDRRVVVATCRVAGPVFAPGAGSTSPTSP